MPTQLEIAMDTMIRIFHQYSCKEGDRFKLNKGELKMLLLRELTEFLSVSPSFLPLELRVDGVHIWGQPLCTLSSMILPQPVYEVFIYFFLFFKYTLATI